MSGLRVPWRGFPDVAAHTTITKMKASPDYLGAKTGDLAAAVRLARSALKPDKLGLLPPFDFIVPVQQVERGSSNALPLGLAVALLPYFPGARLLNTVVQTNVVTHTGADAAARLTGQPLFGGPVLPGRYLLVDDVVTFGSTLANLRGHLETHGGQAVAAVTLGASLFSTRLAPVRPCWTASINAMHPSPNSSTPAPASPSPTSPTRKPTFLTASGPLTGSEVSSLRNFNDQQLREALGPDYDRLVANPATLNWPNPPLSEEGQGIGFRALGCGLLIRRLEGAAQDAALGDSQHAARSDSERKMLDRRPERFGLASGLSTVILR